MIKRHETNCQSSKFIAQKNGEEHSEKSSINFKLLELYGPLLLIHTLSKMQTNLKNLDQPRIPSRIGPNTKGSFSKERSQKFAVA